MVACREVVPRVCVVNLTRLERDAADVFASLMPALLVVPLACVAERVTVRVIGSVGHGVEVVAAALELVSRSLMPAWLVEDAELVVMAVVVLVNVSITVDVLVRVCVAIPVLVTVLVAMIVRVRVAPPFTSTVVVTNEVTKIVVVCSTTTVVTGLTEAIVVTTGAEGC